MEELPLLSLTMFCHINVGAGVIDYDYRGNVFVVLFNHGDKDFVVQAGDRIAQLICEKIVNPRIEEVILIHEKSNNTVEEKLIL